MSFDGLMFRRVCNLLDKEITNCNINRITQLTTTDFVFSLYKKDFRDRLLISTNNNASYITLTSSKFEDFIQPNHFLSILRYHFENGIIQSVQQMELDRIMKIQIKKTDELGISSIKNLYIELTGKMTNMILTKENNIIIDSLHRLGPITQRTIMPGAQYRLPPVQQLKDPAKDNYDFTLNLSEQFFGFSKILEREVQFRLNNGESFCNIISEILTSKKLYVYEKDYHLIEFKHLNQEPKIFDWNEGIEYFYKSYQLKSKKDEETKSLVKVVKKHIKHLSNKITKLNAELDKADDCEMYREFGDFLFAYVEDLSAKKNSIRIKDDDSQIDLTIPLDSKYSIKDNANKFYKKYQKLKTSKNILENQIYISKQDLEYFELLNIQIEDADKIELEQITKELSEQGYIGPIKNKGRKKKDIAYLPETFTAEDGTLISVGKNNLQNEYLTHTLAKYNEYFFHVKEYSGSHVIVHSTSMPSESTIRFAANLAAYYSKARHSSTVPVDYTLVKNVKKIPGGKPGTVIIKNYKTIYIDPKEPK